MDDRLLHAPVGYLSFGADGSIREANDTLLDMLGYQRAELVGSPLDRILTIGSRIFYQTHWFPLLRLHGSAEEIFLILRGKDGKDLGVLVNATRHERDGEAAYDCALMRVRERAKYEDELLRARKAAEGAQEQLKEQKRELEEANLQLRDQTEELVVSQRQLEDQAAELEAATEELRVTNEDLLARTEEADRLREAAELANRAKSRYIAVMSHELRTPLNAIGGYAQILEMGIHGPITPEQRAALSRISSTQAHLLRLISDVLNFARIESGRVEYSMERMSILDVVESTVPMIEPQMMGKSLQLVVRVPPDLYVSADREKVEQVLLNLLGNAVKFTSNGKVEISAGRVEGGRVGLRVRDSGIGIPPEKLETIFDPFVRVDDEAEAEGSGLGLAISREMARAMGGDLAAESEMGRGSRFVLTLREDRGRETGTTAAL